MKIKYSLLIVISFFTILAQAQFQFSNRSDLLGDRNLHSAVPIAIADMNGDGLDDIVALNGGKDLYIQYQTPDPARPFIRYDVPTHIDQAEQNDICIADFNNDGANDIFICGSYDRLKVLYAIPHTYTFNLTYLVVDPFFSQGASSGDFNGDGWVDIVILNDNAANVTLLNDGTGTLAVQDFFDFNTVPASDNSGNYGSLYTDFDMDGDLDFYIAKCRQGVTNPNDPRRIDVLFVNDGQNNYTQNAAAYGLADGHQTWTADFGDIDNDGDLDLFKTQHDVLCQLFENIDNDTFIDITPQSMLNIGNVPLQGMIRDFDNDGWQDILVSGDHVDFYRNNGDHTFTLEEPFGTALFGTFSLGDLNYDGFTDVYASTVVPFNNPDFQREDILYLAEKNANHFLSLNLNQSQNNTSAIGAMATLYSGLGTQIREVRGGEQYGVSHSHTLIFGLGNLTKYDSLVVRWPDGSKESFNNLSVDETWTLHKGGCYSKSIKLWPSLEALCGNDSLVLNAGGLNLATWSTGSTAETLVVKDKGLYFATITDDNDCPVRTIPIEVIKDPDSLKPVIAYEAKDRLCHGDIVQLSLPFGISYQWSTGETGQTILATKTGDYFAAVEGYCKSQLSDTVSLDFNVPPVPETLDDTFKLGEQATLYAVGDSIQWFYDPDGTSVIGYGPVLVLDGLTGDATVYAQNFRPVPGQDFQLGPVQQQGNTKYNAAFVNGGLQFEVQEPIVLKEFTVYTDSAGTRIIEISGSGGFFFDKQVDLEAGTTVIPLNVEIPIGTYTVGTNTDLNNLVFGANSPYLWRSSEGVFYPYEINGVVSIINSTYGSDFYYYFYDWKVSTADKYCGSDLVPVNAVLDTKVATEDVQHDPGFAISPNPTDGISNILLKSGSSVVVEVTSVNGNLLYSNNEKISGNKIMLNLTNYPAGLYFVRLIQDGRIYTQKIIKQ